MRPEIEPIVRLLENTSRARALEELAGRIKKGLSYCDTLAALLLAGVRNIQPRPVGFKFHAVLAVNSAHLASMSAPDSDRWLPIFWGVDYFKSSQARDVREGDWTMGRVDEEAAALMHQWTGFEPGMKNVIVVRNRIICKREPDDIWGHATLRAQEVPACYFTRNFDRFESYLGDGKHGPRSTLGEGQSTPSGHGLLQRRGAGCCHIQPVVGSHLEFWSSW